MLRIVDLFDGKRRLAFWVDRYSFTILNDRVQELCYQRTSLFPKYGDNY